MPLKINIHTKVEELISMDDWAEYLEALLSGPCYISEDPSSGEMKLITTFDKVDKIRGLRIFINPDEDPPPHFHVKSSEVNAKFAIRDCSLLIGTINSRDQKLIRFWFKNGGKDKAISIWDKTRPYECTVGPYRE